MSLPSPESVGLGGQRTVNGLTYQVVSGANGILVWDAVTTGTHGRRLEALEEGSALFMTVSEARGSNLRVGQTVVLVERDYAVAVVKSTGVEDGFGTVLLDNGGYLVVQTAPNTANLRHFGAVGNAMFRDDSTGIWYEDEAKTILATDDTGAFMAAIEATGGIGETGFIELGRGGFLLSPETVDTDGINITKKILKGVGREETRIAMSGNNTLQTLFRNNPRNLSEAGVWGSGGAYELHDMTIWGNWNGSSDQTFIPPPSGAGNGLQGILADDYDFDNQGALAQLISSSRARIINVWFARGYGHLTKFYRGGYGAVLNSRFSATRGSGMYIDAPSANSAWTSTPITENKFETCRGGYGALYISQIWGSSINNNLFEGQPYGIYIKEGGDFDASGNYLESHYYEDFYIDSKCWGANDFANYSFNLQDRREKEYKSLLHYRRDDGFHLLTDTVTYGTAPADINGFYAQRNSIGHGIQPPAIGSQGGVYQWNVLNLSSPGSGPLGWYTAIRHCHNDTNDAGAAEVRFKRNANQNTWSGLGFATYNGAALVERWEMNRSGDFLPSIDNDVEIGSLTNRVRQIYSVVATSVTSDENYKTNIEEIPQRICDAALELEVVRYKLKSSVEEFGEEAQYHYGVIAQDAMKVFEKYGVNIEEFGPITRDILDESKLVDGKELNELWAVRYEELNILMNEALKRRVMS